MKAVMLMMLGTTLVLTSCAATGAATAPGAGAEKQPPKVLDGLSWAEVEAEMKQGALLIDARGFVAYVEGHIEGALSIPVSDESAFRNLPDSKDTRLIFYCSGPHCSASKRAVDRARTLGYTNVTEYKGGYPEWSRLRGVQ